MCSRQIPGAASDLAGTSMVAVPPPVPMQHPRLVVLLQEGQAAGLGRGQPSSGRALVLGCLSQQQWELQTCLLGLSAQLLSSLPLHLCGKNVSIRAASFNFPHTSEMP